MQAATDICGRKSTQKIRVVMLASDRLADFEIDIVSVSIKYRDGQSWPGLTTWANLGTAHEKNPVKTTNFGVKSYL